MCSTTTLCVLNHTYETEKSQNIISLKKESTDKANALQIIKQDQRVILGEKEWKKEPEVDKIIMCELKKRRMNEYKNKTWMLTGYRIGCPPLELQLKLMW